METTIRILKYLVAIVIVAMLGGAASWFFYVRSHQSSIAPPAASVQTAQSIPSAVSVPPSSEASPAATGTQATHAVAAPAARLWQVDAGPIAGDSFIDQGTASASSTHLYFVERANGNVFDADAELQTVLRLTNTLIPKTYEAYISPHPGTALLRTLDNGSITTLLGSFATEEASSTFPGPFGGSTLPANVSSLAFDPSAKGSPLFYLVRGESGVRGYLSSLSGAAPKQIFSSPVSSWRALMAAGNIILLESPSDGLPGYAYTLSRSGTLSLYAGPVPGLQILPHPTQRALIFSSSEGGVLTLYAQIGNNAASALPLATIAEKCAWAPGKTLIAYCAVPQTPPAAGFLDLWYQGAAHTSDTWWQVNAESGAVQELYTPATAVDVRDPSVDQSGSYIAFANGNDMSLLLLRIVQ